MMMGVLSDLGYFSVWIFAAISITAFSIILGRALWALLEAISDPDDE